MNRIQFRQIFSALLLLCLFSSCQQNSKYSEQASAAADSTSVEGYEQDTVSAFNPTPSLLIRKASISMKVKDLRSTSDEIYRATSRYHGSVWNTRWYSEESTLLTKKVSGDSVLTISNFKQYHEMTIRVPRELLDTLLNSIDDQAAVLIARETSTSNAGFEHLANDLKAKSYLKSNERHLSAMETKRSKLEDYSEAESYHNNTAANVVDMQVQNLKLQDESKYSTLTIVLTQDQNIVKTLTFIPNPTQYDPPYYTEVGNAFSAGASFFMELLLVLIRIWPLYIIGFAAWRIYVLWKRKVVPKVTE